MPQIDHVPWSLGQGDIPLAEWLAHMPCNLELWRLKTAVFTLPHSFELRKNILSLYIVNVFIKKGYFHSLRNVINLRWSYHQNIQLVLVLPHMVTALSALR